MQLGVACGWLSYGLKCKLLFDVFELTNNCMQLTRTHHVIVSAMIVVKHHGGLHIIVNAVPADPRRWLGTSYYESQ